MSERTRKVPAWLFGLVVAGALAFGATRAFAKPAYLACTWPPYNGGTCVTNEDCARNCIALYGGYEVARCHTDGCCTCLL